MARGNRPGFLRRIVERLFGGTPEPPREPPERPQGPDWFPPPEPPKLPPPPPGGGPPILPNRPQYDASSDTWSGRGAPTAKEWDRIQTLAYDAISNGACWNKNLDLNDRGEFATGEIAADLAAIIEGLSSGLISKGDITSMLRETRRAASEYALQQDGQRGRARWNSRNRDLPDELFWYHWGY